MKVTAEPTAEIHASESSPWSIQVVFMIAATGNALRPDDAALPEDVFALALLPLSRAEQQHLFESLDLVPQAQQRPVAAPTPESVEIADPGGHATWNSEISVLASRLSSASPGIVSNPEEALPDGWELLPTAMAAGIAEFEGRTT